MANTARPGKNSLLPFEQQDPQHISYYSSSCWLWCRFQNTLIKSSTAQEHRMHCTCSPSSIALFNISHVVCAPVDPQNYHPIQFHIQTLHSFWNGKSESGKSSLCDFSICLRADQNASIDTNVYPQPRTRFSTPTYSTLLCLDDAGTSHPHARTCHSSVQAFTVDSVHCDSRAFSSTTIRTCSRPLSRVRNRNTTADEQLRRGKLED